MAPNQEKAVNLDGRNFKIKKFTPFIASFWATRLFGNMAEIKGLDLDQATVMVQKFIEKITPNHAEFSQFQRDCLKHVYEALPAGDTPLINEQGYFSVELTGPTAFQLTLHSFMYSIADFFTPELLNSLAEGLAGVLGETPQASIEESMRPSTPRSSMDTGSSTSSGMAHTPSAIG